MPQVTYEDATGYQWVAQFETEAEATDQAVQDTVTYGGTPAQEVQDDSGATLVPQEEIIAQAEAAG